MGLTLGWPGLVLGLASACRVVGQKRGGKGVQPLVPELFVVAQPFNAANQGACIQLAGVVAPLDVAYYQPGALQHLHVFGNGGEAHVKGRR